MRPVTRPRQVLRRASIGALLAATIALGACSSSGDADEAAASATAASEGTGATGPSTAGGEDPKASAQASAAPSPASTAPSPSAYYPANPDEDPIVELGPPPPAYVAPRAECPVEAKACVDLTNNMTWIQSGGKVVYGPIQQIAGRRDYRTTVGMHAVSWKNIDHVSSIFDTPMPYAIFFTSDGIAFHEGELNIPSHRCVHLTHEAAVTYWEHLHPGDRVYVFGDAQY